MKDIRIWTKEPPNLIVGAIVLILFISDRFLFNVSMGPFPARIYVFVLIFGLALMLHRNEVIKIPKLLKPLIGVYSLYVIWHFIVIFINGDYKSMNIPNFFLSRYLTIGFTFFILITLVKREATFLFILYAIFFVGFFNAFIVCLQQFQIDIGWIIGDLASVDITYLGDGKYYFKEPQQYPPTVPIGLMGFVVTTGYFICAFAPLSFLFWRKKRYFTFFFLLAVFLLSAIFTQQRSALVLVVPIYVAGIYILSKKKKMILLTFGVLSIPLLLQINTIVQFVIDKVFNNADKFQQGFLDDGIRIYNYLHTFKFIGEYPLWGGKSNYYNLYPTFYPHKFTPHNVLLNAYVDAGIIGFFIILVLIVIALIQFRKTYLYFKVEQKAIPFILFMCSIAYMLNSFFHSSGFTSGDGMFWWFAILAGIYPSVLENSKKYV